MGKYLMGGCPVGGCLGTKIRGVFWEIMNLFLINLTYII